MVSIDNPGTRRSHRPVGLSLLAGLLLAGVGCGALGSGFVDVLDPSGNGQTIDNAPGHVAVQFVNNAEVDERLVNYLTNLPADAGGPLVLTPAERRALRPRVRLRMLVTFTNGIQTTFEIVDGSTRLIDPRFSADAFPDLNQNDLDNAVVLCNVSRVEVAPGSAIEVFIPVELKVYELVQVNTGGVSVGNRFELREQLPPQFRVLQLDQVDDSGAVVIRSNIGFLDFPAPVVEPLCGSVVTIVMSGTLRVPFLAGVDDNPSFDREDVVTVAGIGGRFEITVSVQ